MTIADVAEKIQMSQAAVRKFVLNGMIPYLKIGAAIRFIPSEIVEWLEERKRAKKPKAADGGEGLR